MDILCKLLSKLLQTPEARIGLHRSQKCKKCQTILVKVSLSVQCASPPSPHIEPPRHCEVWPQNNTWNKLHRNSFQLNWICMFQKVNCSYKIQKILRRFGHYWSAQLRWARKLQITFFIILEGGHRMSNFQNQN